MVDSTGYSAPDFGINITDDLSMGYGLYIYPPPRMFLSTDTLYEQTIGQFTKFTTDLLYIRFTYYANTNQWCVCVCLALDSPVGVLGRGWTIFEMTVCKFYLMGIIFYCFFPLFISLYI